jgi:hypothetical protein
MTEEQRVFRNRLWLAVGAAGIGTVLIYFHLNTSGILFTASACMIAGIGWFSHRMS